MVEINLFDKNFAHSFEEDGFDTCSAGREPKVVKWVRNNLTWDGVTVFTDWFLADEIVDKVKSKYKVAWLVEPKSIYPWAYKQIIEVENKFDLILTHDAELLARGSKYKRNVVGSLRVPDKEQKIYDKSKHVSIIASVKNDTEGHQLRHKLIKLCPQLDAWGSGYNKFDSKLDPLKDYMFSVAVMNSRVNNYFTEILTDCFALGTVPIFWGTPNIDNFFNIDGILQFKNIEEFSKIKISKELYKKMLPAVTDNFNRVQNYKSTDDLVAQTLIDHYNIL